VITHDGCGHGALYSSSMRAVQRVSADACGGRVCLLHACLVACCLQITAAFQSALRAAAAVEVPGDYDLQDAAVQRRVVWERRYAAEKELKQQLSKLGLDTSSLTLQGLSDTGQSPRDLLSLARPLA
jgi:hypothetical protein